MAQAQGECVVCKVKFKKGDDVVVCPECGAPYHRECYEKQGHCSFADKHAPGFEYTRPHSAQEKYIVPPTPEQGQGVLCSQCKTINDSRNIFCEKCGTPLHFSTTFPKGQQSQTSSGSAGFPPPFQQGRQAGAPFSAQDPALTQAMEGELDGVSKKEWVAFIGSSAPIYIYRLSMQEKSGSKATFMPSAFLFPYFYFAYRKMWGMAMAAFLSFTLLVVPNVLSMLMDMGITLQPYISVSTLNIMLQVSMFAGIILRVATGFFSLYLYRKNALKKIKKLRVEFPKDEEYYTALSYKGGTSPMGVVIFSLLMFILSSMLYYFIGPDMMMRYFAFL